MTARYTRELLEEAARETTNCNDADVGIGDRHLALHRSQSAPHGGEVARIGRLFQERGGGRSPTGHQPGWGKPSPHRPPHRRPPDRHVALLACTPRPPKRRPGQPLTLGSPSNGRIPGDRLHRELLRTGIAKSCALCGIGTEWNGRPLRLEVDHANGEWWDNRPDNVRLLCPNCHAVKDTYRGRNRRRRT